MVKHKLGQLLDPTDSIEARESASWAVEYINGFPSIPHPSKLTPVHPNRQAAAILWRPIDGKVQQMLKEIATLGQDLLANSRFSPRLAASLDTVQLAAFQTGLVAHMRLRVRPNKPLLLEYLKIDKRLDNDTYSTVLQAIRSNLSSWVEAVR